MREEARFKITITFTEENQGDEVLRDWCRESTKHQGVPDFKYRILLSGTGVAYLPNGSHKTDDKITNRHRPTQRKGEANFIETVYNLPAVTVPAHCDSNHDFNRKLS